MADKDSNSAPNVVLQEARRRGIPLGCRYSAQIHGAHTPDGRKHIHVYDKTNQIFAMNIDGTARDQSHQTQIPNQVAKAMQNLFPEFTIPPNRFVESMPQSSLNTITGRVLVEEK